MSTINPSSAGYVPIFDQAKLDSLITAFVASFAAEQATALEKIKSKTHDPIIAALDFRAIGSGFDWQQAVVSQAVRKNREGRIGVLHQDLIALMPGWKKLPQANADPDLVNSRRKIIVELKSRSNTVKASTQYTVYDDLLASCNGAYRGYTGYYAYILNEKPRAKTQPEAFAPTNNQTGQKRPIDSRIWQVDGKILWAIICDTKTSPNPPYSRPDSLEDVYKEVISSILRVGGKTADPAIVTTLEQLTKSNFSRSSPVTTKKAASRRPQTRTP